jgi:peptidylprolyl isomerase
MTQKASACLFVALVIVLAVYSAGCTEKEASPPTATPSRTAEEGDTVQVHYTGTLEDGTVFDTSVGREPLQFTLGAGQMIPGFEQGVLGMKLGESKTITIPPEQAYGPYYEDRVWVLDRAQLPPGLEPEVGQQLQMTNAQGQIIIVTVTEVSATNITVDANHPLAGKTLTFEIQLVSIL